MYKVIDRGPWRVNATMLHPAGERFPATLTIAADTLAYRPYHCRLRRTVTHAELIELLELRVPICRLIELAAAEKDAPLFTRGFTAAAVPANLEPADGAAPPSSTPKRRPKGKHHGHKSDGAPKPKAEVKKEKGPAPRRRGRPPRHHAD